MVVELNPMIFLLRLCGSAHVISDSNCTQKSARGIFCVSKTRTLYSYFHSDLIQIHRNSSLLPHLHVSACVFGVYSIKCDRLYVKVR